MSRARQEAELEALAPVDGLLVVGMTSSGVEALGEALSVLGLRRLGDRAAEEWDGVNALGARLLTAVAQPGSRLPEPAPVELARSLSSWRDEARTKLAQALGADRGALGRQPWVWADPDLSFLAPFWAETMAARPALVLVHRSLERVVDAEGASDPESIAKRWDRHNRSALVLCSHYPSFVVDYEDAARQPKAVLSQIVDFLAGLGIVLTGDLGRAAQSIEDTISAPDREWEGPWRIGAGHRTLELILGELDGQQAGRGEEAAKSLIALTSEFYGEDYYGADYDTSGIPYRRDQKVWTDFFDAVASSIVKTLRPHSVLDVGCAIGMLVESLRARSVDARGLDLSSWAISQVPATIAPYCTVASVTEEIEGHYDLITCIEVLEHLPPSLVDLAVGNLCRHADSVLFSSTPDDFDEPTHLNVKPGSYWAERFLRHGFVRDVDYVATYLAPHAVLFRRGEVDSVSLVESYERAWSVLQDTQHLRNEHAELMLKYDALGEDRDRLQREATELTVALHSANARRAAETLAAYEEIKFYEADQRRLAAMLSLRDAEITAVYDTKLFRYSTKLRALYARLRGGEVASGPAVLPIADAVHPADGSYQTWIEVFDTIDDAKRRQLHQRVAALSDRPTISVLMPVYNTPVALLRAAVNSVRAQIYQDWELCIADDCSTDPEVVRLLEECAASDARIKVLRRDENGHISAASNSALSLATGKWIALLDHDDLLAEHALALVALTLSAHPDVGMLYSDEDKIDELGQRRDPFFKPDFDPLLLLGQNFVSHLSVLRKDLVDQVGGYREGYEGSQDWDIVLRVSELLAEQEVVHIPHVLYHWRVHPSSTASLVSAKPYAVEAGRRAVTDHLRRTGRPASVVRIGKSGHNRVVWSMPERAPRVSIVVPTRDGRLLQRCVDSVLSLTTYPDFEIVVVDNSGESWSTLQYLQVLDQQVKVLRDERLFNFAGLNNEAVKHTSGELICLLNDDTEVINHDWLTEMVSQIQQPGVGAVGAKLYYDEARVQHAGTVLGIHGVAGHAFRMFDRLSPGYFGNLQLAHRMSAVTAACILVRRDVWDDVEGLNEVHLPVAFNDVDFCLRVKEAGWEIVWTPYAELYHHESTTRGPDDMGARAAAFRSEVKYMETRWGFERLRNDPYYSPNLSLDAEDFSLAWPPRKPWYAGRAD